MTDPLLQAFPHLSPPLSLGRLPTPVEPAPWLGPDVWVKRDDLISPEGGGNKIRKLAWLLAGHDGRPLAALGPTGSNWLAAAARVSRELGFPLSVHRFRVPSYPGSQHKDRLTSSLAASAPPPSSLVRASCAYALAGLRGARLLPAGGSDARGTLACASAVLELATQVKAGLLPPPACVYVAYGSGGTAVGLALGLELAGLPGRVRAVRVADRALANPILARRLAAGALALLGHPGDPGSILARRLEWVHSELGAGYARPTRRSMAAVFAAREAGLPAEPVYTGKALAALLRDRERRGARGPMLYWHTYGPAGT